MPPRSPAYRATRMSPRSQPRRPTSSHWRPPRRRLSFRPRNAARLRPGSAHPARRSQSCGRLHRRFRSPPRRPSRPAANCCHLRIGSPGQRSRTGPSPLIPLPEPRLRPGRRSFGGRHRGLRFPSPGRAHRTSHPPYRRRVLDRRLSATPGRRLVTDPTRRPRPTRFRIIPRHRRPDGRSSRSPSSRLRRPWSRPSAGSLVPRRRRSPGPNQLAHPCGNRRAWTSRPRQHPRRSPLAIRRQSLPLPAPPALRLRPCRYHRSTRRRVPLFEAATRRPRRQVPSAVRKQPSPVSSADG